MIDKNIKIEIVTEERINEVLNFQKEIIDNMNRKALFCPLTKEEFLTPIKKQDNVYFLKYNNEIIGLFVATCNIPDVLKEYQLKSNNVMLIDSIMIKEKYRGNKLQIKILNYLYNRAKELKLDGLVATIHPENTYSLNNFINNGYKIINTLHIHGGIRNIVFKKIIY